jgi:sugar phosphate isomerase/epimerase
MGIGRSRLGCSEKCLKGGFEEKLEFLEERGLWLELANEGERDLSLLESYRVSVKTVQAYMLHKLHWLSPVEMDRVAAQSHVRETCRLAEELGAQNVLTVPTYGFSMVQNSRAVCIENYRKAAKETSLNILVESLLPRRTSFLPNPFEVAALVEEIALENVRLAVDSLHIKEAGFEPASVIERLDDGIVEVHLKDDDSRPPGKGGIDFEEIIKSCSTQLLCLEFVSVSREEFSEASDYIMGI